MRDNRTNVVIEIETFVELLQRLIATQSYSLEEGVTADIIASFLHEQGVDAERYGNNVVARHIARSAVSVAIETDPYPASSIPFLLLNSHHDTVRAANGWTKDPLTPTIEDGKLFGLGSNDAGGALVTMIATFLHLRQHTDLPYNIMFAATAEEEISGTGGMELLARKGLLEGVALAIVGEPTQMQMAIAERGLMVLDCKSHGRSGHAARGEGINAIYSAMRDIEWFRTHQFEKQSAVLGPIKMTVTQIDAGTQHNVVPDQCHFVVDVRVTDVYSNEELIECIRESVECSVTPRSMRLRPSAIPLDHPLVAAATALHIPRYASPTMSDQSLLPNGIPSVKIGPGDSARSHTPDEYIGLDELSAGITTMIALCENFLGVASSPDESPLPSPLPSALPSTLPSTLPSDLPSSLSNPLPSIQSSDSLKGAL